MLCGVSLSGITRKSCPDRRLRPVHHFNPIHQASDQPSRGSRRKKRSASGAFVAVRAAASHSNVFPTRYATLPRWFASVSQPAYSKLQVVAPRSYRRGATRRDGRATSGSTARAA